MSPPIQIVFLALAGAGGTLLRVGCTMLAERIMGHGFPWGTLAVNVAGSFAFGVLHALARSRGLLSAEQEWILLVGLLGGFTTYSSFVFQACDLLSQGRTAAAVGYVAATNALALAAVWLGLRACGPP